MSNCGEYLAAHRESVRRAKARGWSKAERLAVVRATLSDRRVS